MFEAVIDNGQLEDRATAFKQQEAHFWMPE